MIGLIKHEQVELELRIEFNESFIVKKEKNIESTNYANSDDKLVQCSIYNGHRFLQPMNCSRMSICRIYGRDHLLQNDPFSLTEIVTPFKSFIRILFSRILYGPF